MELHQNEIYSHCSIYLWHVGIYIVEVKFGSGSIGQH